MSDITRPVQNFHSGPNSPYSDEAELSLKDIYYILRRNLRIIAIATITILFLAAVVTLLTPPVYESTAMIMVEEPNQSMAIFDLGFDNEMNLLNNEIEILKSRTLAESAVEHLWESGQRNNLFLFGTNVYQPEGPRKLLRQLLTLGIWQQDSAEALFGAIPDSVKMAAVKAIRGNMLVTNQRNTNVLNVTFSSPDPAEAALLANTLVELYSRRDQDWTTGEILNLKDFLDEQLVNTERELAQVEDSLRSFQEREQVYEVGGAAQLLLQQLTNIEGRFYTTKAEQNI
ncbi:MAG: Wzz/FepE/Etk N-terminal domain-containing protein, partial [Candidatus Neomarinimicrobiota bacterium]